MLRSAVSEKLSSLSAVILVRAFPANPVPPKTAVSLVRHSHGWGPYFRPDAENTQLNPPNADFFLCVCVCLRRLPPRPKFSGCSVLRKHTKQIGGGVRMAPAHVLIYLTLRFYDGPNSGNQAFVDRANTGPYSLMLSGRCVKRYWKQTQVLIYTSVLGFVIDSSSFVKLRWGGGGWQPFVLLFCSLYEFPGRRGGGDGVAVIQATLSVF